MVPLWIIDLSEDNCHQQALRGLIKELDGASGIWYHSPCPINDYSDAEYVWLDDLIKYLISQGQKFIRKIDLCHPSNECLTDICVIGNVAERRTQVLFSSIAALIKHYKGNIIPDHVHQGINILGMLYVPSDINTLDFLKRQSALRCMKELEIQHRINSAGGFDKVVLFQDVQHKTERFYPALSWHQQVEFLFQCLVNIYYTKDDDHPLFEGLSVNDDVFVSMGAGSLFYDTKDQDDKDIRLVEENLLRVFKLPCREDKLPNEFLLDTKEFSPKELMKMIGFYFEPVPPDIESHRPGILSCLRMLVRNPDEEETEESSKVRGGLDIIEPDPDPVKDMFSRWLKRFYYNTYLRVYPRKVLESIVERVANASESQLCKVNGILDAHLNRLVGDVSNDGGGGLLPLKIYSALSDEISRKKGGILYIKGRIRQLQNKVSEFRKDAASQAEREMWQPLITGQIPRNIRDPFVEYHDASKADADSGQPQSRKQEKKEEAGKNLCSILASQPTMLARISRSFLAGIIFMLSITPILDAISPRFVDLGNVNGYSFIWGTLIFLIPALIECIRYALFAHRRDKCIRALIAYYHHDAYERLANRIMTRIDDFYGKLYDLCDSYQERCDRIVEFEVPEYTSERKQRIPETTFNKSLLEGSVMHLDDNVLVKDPLFDSHTVSSNRICIKGNSYDVGRLSDDRLYDLIKEESPIFRKLFSGVQYGIIPDKMAKNKVLPNPVESKQRRAEYWNEAKAVFGTDLRESVRRCLVPRLDSTVAKKLEEIRRSENGSRGVELFCRFCATNGEFTSDDNNEYSDVKVDFGTMANDLGIRRMFDPYLPVGHTSYQTSSEPLFKEYLFLTRWRSFNTLSMNRILPEFKIFDRDMCVDDGYGNRNIVPASTVVLYALFGGAPSEWVELVDLDYFNSMRDCVEKIKFVPGQPKSSDNDELSRTEEDIKKRDEEREIKENLMESKVLSRKR